MKERQALDLLNVPIEEKERSNSNNLARVSQELKKEKQAYDLVHTLHANWVTRHSNTKGLNTQRTRIGKNISLPNTTMNSTLTDNRPTQLSDNRPT